VGHGVSLWQVDSFAQGTAGWAVGSISQGGVMSIAMPQKGNNTSTHQAVEYGCICDVNV